MPTKMAAVADVTDPSSGGSLDLERIARAALAALAASGARNGQRDLANKTCDLTKENREL